MPKVYLSATDREAARRKRADEVIRGMIWVYLKETGCRQRDFAAMVGMSAPTLSRRITDPGEMTLGELRDILKAIGASEEARAKCL